MGSGQGWWASIPHPTPCPHQFIFALGLLGAVILHCSECQSGVQWSSTSSNSADASPGAELFQLPLCATLSLNAAINLSVSLCQVFQNFSDHLSFCAWEMY